MSQDSDVTRVIAGLQPGQHIRFKYDGQTDEKLGEFKSRDKNGKILTLIISRPELLQGARTDIKYTIAKIKACRVMGAEKTAIGDETDGNLTEAAAVAATAAASAQSPTSSPHVPASSARLSEDACARASDRAPHSTATGPNPSPRRARGDNRHLGRLLPLQMDDLLQQKQATAPPELKRLSLQPGKPFCLEKPKQNRYHQEGEDYKERIIQEYRIIRQTLWESYEEPPELLFCADKFHVLDDPADEDECLQYALDALRKTRRVGVSLEGQCLGRHGQLSLLAFSAPGVVYLFDVVKLGQELLHDETSVLRRMLLSDKVEKVMHDSRMAADLLFHQYGIKLTNVYDTMAGHIVFSSWAIYYGHVPRYTYSLSAIVRAYLGVVGEDLFFPHYRQAYLKQDTSVWLERPLTDQLRLGAVRNAMYLLDLWAATDSCMKAPFRRATDALLGAVRDLPDIDSETYRIGPDLPKQVSDCLPDWTPNQEKASKRGVVEGRMVHNMVCQADNNVIFSRDTLHQRQKMA